MIPKPDMLRISVDNGKYTVVQDHTGKLFALRDGEFWRDCVGDNLIYWLAAELYSAREDLKNAAEAKNRLLKIIHKQRARLKGIKKDRF